MDSSALLCNICPKRPNFSDVSHLLTHVSSKAHLSNYFKLQVRSHQEPPAGDLLREYDHWYKANSLAKLLADRMASKEARKKKSQSKTSKHSTPYLPKKAGGSKLTTTVACPSPHQSLPSFLDPRLSESYLNAGPMTESGNALPSTYITPTLTSTLSPQPNLRTDFHQPSTPPKGSVSSGQRKPETRSERQNVNESHIQTPTRHKNLGSGGDSTPRLLRSGLSYDPFVDYSDTLEYLGISENDKERADEIARLKGVLWPGMDIFDSATEQMRKKRNQKKDESILKMMEKTSMCVEPTEFIFSPTGILRKQRVISGNVEDSSPLKGETPIPKRRAVRPKRGLLSQADPNVPHGQYRKRPRKSRGFGLRKPSEEPSRLGLRISRSPAARRPGLRYYSAHSGEHDELELSVRALERKPRNGFEVFHDGEDNYKMNFKDQYEQDGLPLASSTSSPYHRLTRRDAMTYGSFQPPIVGSYASTIASRAYLSSDKENVEPLLTGHGRIDPLVGWSSPLMKRRYAGDTGYPPQYFMSESQRPGLAAFEGHDMFTGYSCNPLATSFSKFHEENHIYSADADIAADIKPQSGNSPGSSEATISDIEHDDFERLYLDGSSY
ncbi:hypothetical protein PHISCL_00330 [Aspergillus sclerotialis]|uniref:Uncharacterized protein n=1 Tax=Aspergillus sclerotialis TaxID=2070753 RepID=A0A3A2ZXA3_9EURO|nr:hypothetical protein PHISCL_00330 [Aspergillus sclerotialis]